VARGGGSYLDALASHGARMVMLRRQRESTLVAQILKTRHLFDSRPKLTRAGWKHSCTSGQKWDRT